MVAFPKRLELKWHEMVIKTMMLSCVNTIFLNNLSFTEHIIPFWKLIHLRKISLWRLLLLRMHEKEVANHACAFLNRLKKYKKATIYKYKYIQNSQSIKEGMNASFWHLFLQHWNTFLWVFSYKSNSNKHWQEIRNAWDALWMWFCVKGKKIREVEAKCYNNCVSALPRDLSKGNEKKKKKQKRPALIKEKKIQVVILVTSLWVVWKCTKGTEQKKKKTRPK